MVEYDVTACALNGSCKIFIAKSRFFTFTPINFKEVPKNTVKTLRPSTNGPEVNMKMHSSAPFALQVDTTLVMDKGIKKLDMLATNASKKALPGVSVKFSTKDPCYSLGDCVTVTSSPSISEHMRIDSISYRLLRHVKLKSSLASTPDDSQVSDVLFGAIRPAVTHDAVTDLVELPLPCASLNDCVWTTDGSLFSCRYEVEVTIAISLDSSITTTVGNIEYPPITLTLPVKVVPPQTSKEPCLPPWTSLCLVALAEGEPGVSPQLSKAVIQEWGNLPGASFAPCQTVRIRGGQRGAAGLTPSAAQSNPEFRKIPVFRHLGATQL
ncbi:expressed conserved protein [Echinococcus multilocularis]|uniref:Expressed conserved protein n=1 Tax=Echinococcus multilocularis TaxID=6211 RepID=A0A068YIG9_ECHMU|nr:expressed conserved protein [Echinococcus multilocularis]